MPDEITARKLTVGSLFAGVGGFDLAAEQAGFEVKWAVEIDDQCRQLLGKRFPKTRVYDDVRMVGARNLEPVDIICGGFPCQGASEAGERGGLNDPRTGLFYEMVRITAEMMPWFLKWENVPGLATGGDEIYDDGHACVCGWHSGLGGIRVPWDRPVPTGDQSDHAAARDGGADAGAGPVRGSVVAAEEGVPVRVGAVGTDGSGGSGRAGQDAAASADQAAPGAVGDASGSATASAEGSAAPRGADAGAKPARRTRARARPPGDSFACPSCGRTLGPATAGSFQHNWLGTVVRELSRIGYRGAVVNLDSQYFGLAQRRRRLFGLFTRLDLGASGCAEILSFAEGMRGHPAPRRKTREGNPAGAGSGAEGRGGEAAPGGDSGGGRVAGGLQGSTGGADENDAADSRLIPERAGTLGCGQQGGFRTTDLDNAGAFIPEVSPPVMGAANRTGGDRPMGTNVDTCGSLIPEITGTVSAKWAKGGGPAGDEAYNLVPAKPIAFNWQAGESDDLAPQTDRALPCRVKQTQAIVFDTTQITNKDNRSNPQPGAPCHTLAAGANAPAIAFDPSQSGAAGGNRIGDDLAPTLGTNENNAAVAFRAAGQDGFTPSEVAPPIAATDGGGAGAPTIAFKQSQSGVRLSEVHATLDANKGSRRMEGVLTPAPDAAAFKPSHYTRDKDGAPSDKCPPLTADADKGDQDPVVFQTRFARNGRGGPSDMVPALTGAEAGETSDMRNCVASTYAVRRLTPKECERLQGFPDDWTADYADSPRYRMCGNAISVPVVRFLFASLRRYLEKHGLTLS